MAASVVATYVLKLSVVETIALEASLVASDPFFPHLLQSKGTLKSDTTLKVTKVFSRQYTMTGTEDVLDLTALTHPSGSELDTRDFTGLKLVLAMFKSASANNATGITIEGNQVSLPYEIHGGNALSRIDLKPGDAEIILLNAAAAVSSSVRNIKFTGTNDDVYDVLLVAGPT